MSEIVRIELKKYASDIAKRTMNLTPEISDKEMQELENFIMHMLVEQGNPEVSEVLVYGIRDLFKLWQEVGKDEEKFELARSAIYKEGIDKRGHVW